MDRIRHPIVISIMTVGFNPVNFYIVMEHFKSSDLRKILRSTRKDVKYQLSDEHKIYILSQLCKAISFLHQLSVPIIHKDLKPEKILVNEEGDTKICDLGLSKCDDLPSALHTTVGRNRKIIYSYMAPEILVHNEPTTTKSDVWSLACIIHKVYTGEETWEAHLRTTKGSFSTISDKLKKIFELKKKPDLSEVPQ
ncbi:cyclin-dependent kinase 3-like [Nasonia vitripennis]|uniref:Protein kinase domain-containing protein n=1 Tax=Nasonia vitripennis TaxID=7425 RepID=A0A7M7IZT2_NASVI|nr:cyclin-dependent kinase 3-like [Nasonia vitripennis]